MGNAPVIRDSFAEMYVAGILADADWAVYFPRRDVGFDFVLTKMVEGNMLIRPVQVKGKYPEKGGSSASGYGFKGTLTALHPDMILAIPYFPAGSKLCAPENVALMPYDQIKFSSKGSHRCIPANFDGSNSTARKSFKRYFFPEVLQLIESKDWGRGV